MNFDLVAMAKRKTNSRRVVVLRPIFTTTAMAESLALIYLRTIVLLEARSAKLLQIYERTIAQTLRTDTVDELGNELESTDEAMRRLVLELTPDLKRWAFRTELWHRGKWGSAILDAVSISLETMLGPQDMRETLDVFLERNTALIRNIGDEARGRIADSIFRGFRTRSTAPEMAKEIREATNMARARAIRVASDQTVKLASALTAERRRQAGLDHWKWRHSGKVHFRPDHKARDGNIYSDETAPEDLPGVLPYCGCVEQAVLDLSQ